MNRSDNVIFYLCIPEVNAYILFNKTKGKKKKKVLECCQEINRLLQFPGWSELLGVKILCLQKIKVASIIPNGSWLFFPLLILSVSALRDCSELPGATGRTPPKGTANSYLQRNKSFPGITNILPSRWLQKNHPGKSFSVTLEWNGSHANILI